jgi:uncharacterized protein involved in exopolysaccharide biosynthesis
VALADDPERVVAVLRRTRWWFAGVVGLVVILAPTLTTQEQRQAATKAGFLGLSNDGS